MMNLNKIKGRVEPLDLLVHFSLNRKKESLDVENGKGFTDEELKE